jgi:hypothetical protein
MAGKAGKDQPEMVSRSIVGLFIGKITNLISKKLSFSLITRKQEKLLKK